MQMAICYHEAGQSARAAEIYDEHLTADAFSRRDYGYFCALAGNRDSFGWPPGRGGRVRARVPSDRGSDRVDADAHGAVPPG